MKTLTHYQKEFLLNYFFNNTTYSGWKRVAEKLLETGQCIVGGEHRIWIGGIGNFIEMETAKDAVGCSLYTFDLDNLLSSTWYKTVKDHYFNELLIRKKELEQEYEEMVTSKFDQI